MTEFKIGDRVRDNYTEYKGTVSGIIDEDYVGVHWDTAEACSTTYLTKIAPDPDETRTVDDLSDEEWKARGFEWYTPWNSWRKIDRNCISYQPSRPIIWFNGSPLAQSACKETTVAQFDRLIAVLKEIEEGANS